MRPDDRFDPGDAGSTEALLDADLVDLDAELAGAGAYARRAHASQSRPTAAFAGSLRGRLLAGLAAGGATAAGGEGPDGGAWRGHGQPARGSTLPRLTEPGEAWTPVALTPRIAGRQPPPAPRARWMLLAATLSMVVVAGALGAGLGWLQPRPSTDPSAMPSAAVMATTGPTATADPQTQAPIVVVPTDLPPEPTAPVPTPKATTVPTKAPAATAKPTPKPEPTKPPIGPMDLGLKACPGGVFIDWTKPSTAVAHYHVLRSVDGDVPPTYPADGAVEVETATTWSAGATEGYDVTIDGGTSATYRVFAFDASDQLLAWSPSRTATTAGRIDLGALSVEDLAAGKIGVSWAAAELHAACFTYGKLVISESDPEPSYLKGSTYIAVVSDPLATSVVVEGLPSGKTVWMRYEIVRTTGTGKFIVARSSVIQVTFP